jgi:hypothetical protein
MFTSFYINSKILPGWTVKPGGYENTPKKFKPITRKNSNRGFEYGIMHPHPFFGVIDGHSCLNPIPFNMSIRNPKHS